MRIINTFLLLAGLINSWHGASAQIDPLVTTTFTDGDSTGWSLVRPDGNQMNFLPEGTSSGVSGTDQGSALWYFQAPSAFSGNLINAYNGRLEFVLEHSWIMDDSKKISNKPDVILEAQCGHSLTWSGPVDGQVSIMLNEKSGWKDSRTGRPPKSIDFFGVLSHLKGIKIRGGYYASAETSTLRYVFLYPGKAWYPCCIFGSIDVCGEVPNPYDNPPNLVHYCEGSFKRLIQVNRVEPRFARRTGGATITVTGENFGLSGSKPIVRINGRQCQQTYFPASTYISNLDSFGVPSSVPNGFVSNGATAGNPAGNALVNAFNAATDSFKDLYPEHCWNGMRDDGTDTGYNYGTPTAAKYINQGETGIDTGGPCFPSHCSSCPDNSKGWCSGQQIAAVSSGSCKGRAIDAAGVNLACARGFPYRNYPRLCPDDADTPLQSSVVTQPPAAGTLGFTVNRTAAPALTAQATVIDLLDVRSTALTAPVSPYSSVIQVNSSLALTCAAMNTPARDCSRVGTTEQLAENYIKVVDLSNATYLAGLPLAPIPYEVMKVVSVSLNAITVMRAQGGTAARNFNSTFGSRIAVFLCGRTPNCLTAVSDLQSGRAVKVDDEIMTVANYAAIGSVTGPVASCGGSTATSYPLVVTCAWPCVSATALQGFVNTNTSGHITGVTITNPGSGYDPNNLPTLGSIGTCALTPWWSSLVVARAAAETRAAAHANPPVTVTRLNCLDGDETGDNCGGSCKPCPEKPKGPTQHTQLVCVTPEAPQDQPMTDLAVTVEAAPGPTDSPYSVRMDATLQHWADASTNAVSCITDSSRGFSYGAHDFAWGVHMRTVAGSTHVTAMAVDENNGEVYVTGTMQGPIYLEGKHIMTRLQMGSLTVSPGTAAYPLTTACTGAVNQPHEVAGTAADDCGRASFVARFSRDGRPMWLNLVQTSLATAAASVSAQAVITDASFDPTKAELYVVGYFSDGMSTSNHTLSSSVTLQLYDIDPATRAAATATPSAVLAAQAPAATNRYYEEGFIAKYSRAGAVQWVKSVGNAPSLPAAETGFSATGLRVVAYKASTSNQINTQLPGAAGAAATLPTHTSRTDVEYDTGVLAAAVQGGTGTDSSATLKSASSSVNKWYNGLQLVITEGAGYGQKVTIYEYNGTTKVARVHPDWDPNDTPGAGSKYKIVGGRPASWLSGMHWSNGGVYVSGRLQTVCGLNCANFTNRGGVSVVIGEMPAAYRDLNALTTPKYLQATLGQDDHQNFLAQFNVDGQVYWSRFVGVNGASGFVTSSANLSAFTLAPDASATDGYYVGSTVTVISGPGAGQARRIIAYTGALRLVTVASNFTAYLTTSSQYIVSNFGTAGTATAGSITSLTLQAGPAKNTMSGVYNGSMVVVTGGSGQGQIAKIQSYNGSTMVATISQLQTPLDSTSTYHILDGASIAGMTAVRDMVFLTGTFTGPGLRAHNCSFDAATVTEGPPANTAPTTVFQCAVAGGAPATANGASKAEAVIAGSAATDVAVGAVGNTTSLALFTVAYNGSGAAAWLHYAAEGAVRPKAIAAVAPSLGGRALRGAWGGTPEAVSAPGRNQVPYAEYAKDVSSEKWATAVVKGTFVVVAGEVYDHTNAADFGRTRLPLECSRDQRVGRKGLSTSRLADAPCAGKVVAQATVGNWWPTATKTNAVPDVILVIYDAVTGQVQEIRRTGQPDAVETVSGIATDWLTGAVYLSGDYFLQSATNYQGSASSPAVAAGEDVFGLDAAQRSGALGCPRDRRSDMPADPYCRLYSHSAVTSRPTGYVIKYNFNGDETNRGNLNRAAVPSVTGYFVGGGASTADACAATSPAAADTAGATHVLTGAAACATHVSGCSCVTLSFQSKSASSAPAAAADSSAAPYGPGPLSMYSGYKIRVTAGKSMGYEGIISGYSVAAGVYNVIPALPAAGVDESSVFQLFPYSQYTPRNHLNSCAKAADVGCSSYGVEWAKTVGNAVGGGASVFLAQSSARLLARMDSDIYVAGAIAGFLGTPTFGIEGVDESPASATAYRTNGATPSAGGAAGASFVYSANDTFVVLASDASTRNDYYKGLYLSILEGPAAGQTRLITTYAGGATRIASLIAPFSPTPTNASRYVISTQATGGAVGGANNGTAFTLATSASPTSGFYVGYFVAFVAGPNAGETRAVTAYDGGTRQVTVDSALPFTPTPASQYVLYYPAGLASQTDGYLIKLQD